MSLAAELIGGDDLAKKTSLGYNISGMGAADAASDAADIQAKSGKEAIGFARETRDIARGDLQPFTQFGVNNLAPLQSMLTPQGQTDYLRNNPLFQAALDNTNAATLNNQAARGRLGSGGTLDALTKNYFATAQPLLQSQTANLFNATTLGQNSAAGQASTSINQGNSINDLITGIGNSQAAGLVGGANARQAGATNFVGSAGSLLGAFSDRRLKRNISYAGEHGPYSTYYYQYLNDDQWYRGVMSDEVKLINPAAVSTHDSGFDIVNYGAL